MRKNEAEVNVHPFGDGFAIEGKEVVGLEREVDRFGERKLHAEVGVDKEKVLLVYYCVSFRHPVTVGAVKDKQCSCFAAAYA